MPIRHVRRPPSDHSSDDSEDSGLDAAAATLGATATAVKRHVMRTMVFQPMDPDVLARNGLDVRNCASLEIDAGDELYDALVEYVAEKEPAASPSLWLSSGTWRRNENTDPGAEDVATTPSANAKKDDGDEVPDHEPPPFDPVYAIGPGVTRLPTPDGSWVAVASAVGKFLMLKGSAKRLACLYTPLEAGPAGPAVAGAAAATDASADTTAATDALAAGTAAAPDAVATSTEPTAAGSSVAPARAETPDDSAAADEGDGASESAIAAPAAGGDDGGAEEGAPKQPHEYRHARERFTALIMAVLKWKHANDQKQRKVEWFNLHRFEVVGDLSGRWRLQGKHMTRRVDTIVLNPTIRDALLDDARAFDTKSALRWYTRHGLPYRRCYLFYGPPGTGKSSFIRALAGVLKRSIAFLQCAHNKLNDQILADAFRDCPAQSILVLEDIDCLFTTAAGGVGARESRAAVHISLAGLLNALDGLLSGSRGRITVLSSNHPQLLDAALIRSGRVDHRVEFALPTRADMVTLFTSFYPEAAAASAAAFADKVFSAHMSSEDRTVATMQQLFIKYRGRSATEVLDGVEAFLEERQSGPMGADGRGPGVYL